jgi:E3 ubiquitin-protein ligase UBR4
MLIHLATSSYAKRPRSSAVGGPLMRDVKNFVCRTLDLQGLIDDDYGLELLVDGCVSLLKLLRPAL